MLNKFVASSSVSSYIKLYPFKGAIGTIMMSRIVIHYIFSVTVLTLYGGQV
jgi:hypothetical protein